jgi:hypothetical protein
MPIKSIPLRKVVNSPWKLGFFILVIKFLLLTFGIFAEKSAIDLPVWEQMQIFESVQERKNGESANYRYGV